MIVDHHAMRLDCRDARGEEEWVCPHCGRRVRVTWPVDLARHEIFAFDEGDDHLVITGSPLGVTFVYKQVVTPANERVVHHFARHGQPAAPALNAVTPLSDEMRAWLADAGFERWWNARAV